MLKIISFTWPCLAELLLLSLISMVSLVMVGHLGTYAISSVGLTIQPVLLSLSAFEAFNIGATSLVARFTGAKDHESAKIVVEQTLLISVFLGIVLSVLTFLSAHWLVVFMGAKSDTVKYAERYMQYMAAGILFQSVPIAVSSLLRGIGKVKIPMYFNIIANIVNIAVGFLLINGLGFIPRLGLEGSAIASTVAKIIACVLSVLAITKMDLPFVISFKKKLKINPGMLKRIMGIGYAAAGEQLILRIGVLLSTKLVADLGTISFAAHQVSISILVFSFNFGLALSMASTSFTGRSLGAGSLEKADKYIREIRKTGFVVSMAMSAVFFIFGHWIAGLYTGDKSVIALSALLLKIIAIILPAQNSQLIIAGGLRGAGDTRWPLFSALLGIIIFRLLLGFVLVVLFRWGLTGAWAAIVADQFARSLVVYLRHKSGRWKYIKV